MKRILRDKENFDVLEGFLSVLLNEAVRIYKILGSQSNQETDDDKYNDVDILVENAKGEHFIIEVQNTKEYDYFHRILYGTSKVITEYIKESNKYASIKKVISITVAYFDLGQGHDYVYHGTNSFKGLHKGDVLMLSEKQKELYSKKEVYEIYPEYWIIKAGIFDEEKVNDELDEWIYFLKTGEVQDKFTAPGLAEAKEKLDRLKLTPAERAEYEAYLQRIRRLASYRETEIADAQDLIEKGKEEKTVEAVVEMYKDNVPPKTISKYLNVSEEKAIQIIEAYLNK